VDVDNLFSSRALPLRVKVAAHVLQMRRKMEDSGVTTIHEDITELAER